MKSLMIAGALTLLSLPAGAESLQCHNGYTGAALQLAPSTTAGLYDITLNIPHGSADLSVAPSLPADQGYALQLHSLKCQFGSSKFIFECQGYSSDLPAPSASLVGLIDQKTYAWPLEFVKVENVITQTQNILGSSSMVVSAVELYKGQPAEIFAVDALSLASPLPSQDSIVSCQ